MCTSYLELASLVVPSVLLALVLGITLLVVALVAGDLVLK